MNNKEQCTLWEERLKEQQASGKTICAWCKEHSIKEGRFYYWRKKLQTQANNKQQIRWLPLEAAETAEPGAIITVQLG